MDFTGILLASFQNVYRRLITKRRLLAFTASLLVTFLVSAPTSTQTSTKGTVLVIVSSEDEMALQSEQLGGKMLFYPEAAMKMASGEIQVAQPWSSNVVQDRKLITGQNPFSDNALAETLLSAIAEKKAIED